MKWRIGTDEWITAGLTDKLVAQILDARAKHNNRYAPFIEADIEAVEHLQKYRDSIFPMKVGLPTHCQNIPIHLVQ